MSGGRWRRRRVGRRRRVRSRARSRASWLDFGAAGGDEGVGGPCGVDLGASARVTRASSAEAAGAWSQESREGLSALAARSAAAATASGGQCRWAAQRGSAGSAAPSARVWTRVRRASVAPGRSCGSTSAGGGAHACGDGVGAAGREGAARGGARPRLRASRTVSRAAARRSGLRLLRARARGGCTHQCGVLHGRNAGAVVAPGLSGGRAALPATGGSTGSFDPNSLVLRRRAGVRRADGCRPGSRLQPAPHETPYACSPHFRGLRRPRSSSWSASLAAQGGERVASRRQPGRGRGLRGSTAWPGRHSGRRRRRWRGRGGRRGSTASS